MSRPFKADVVGSLLRPQSILDARAQFNAGKLSREELWKTESAAVGEAVAKEASVRYDMLLNVFDRSIIEVENRVYGDSIQPHLLAALERTFRAMPETAARRDHRGGDPQIANGILHDIHSRRSDSVLNHPTSWTPRASPTIPSSSAPMSRTSSCLRR